MLSLYLIKWAGGWLATPADEVVVLKTASLLSVQHHRAEVSCGTRLVAVFVEGSRVDRSYVLN